MWCRVLYAVVGDGIGLRITGRIYASFTDPARFLTALFSAKVLTDTSPAPATLASHVRRVASRQGEIVLAHG
jgi:hypothetical protein